MPYGEEVARAYAAWTKAHRELLEAEMLLAGIPASASAATRQAAQGRVQELRTISDALLELATEVLRRHEAARGREGI